MTRCCGITASAFSKYVIGAFLIVVSAALLGRNSAGIIIRVSCSIKAYVREISTLLSPSLALFVSVSFSRPSAFASAPLTECAFAVSVTGEDLIYSGLLTSAPPGSSSLALLC
jgi:hypothetical protein